MIRSYVYKLKPTKTQITELERYLDVTRAVYNAALEQRMIAWNDHRESISWMKQSGEIKELRECGLLEGCHVHAVKMVLRRLDRAYQKFFRQCRAGARGGYPRFKSARYWRSIQFPEFDVTGCMLRDGKLRIVNVGLVRIKQHRSLLGTPKSCDLIRKADGWYVKIACDIGDPPPLRDGGRATGLDLGFEHFATLADGSRVANPRHLRTAQTRIKSEQHALAKKRWSSGHRDKQRERLALTHLKVARARRDFHHKLALDLVQRFDRIAVENLAVAAMRSTGSEYARRLNRSMSDVAWGQFLTLLAEKCEYHGVELVCVDPKQTSQECAQCGAVRYKELSQRRHECPCGANLDRDHNAAINIMNRAWAVPVVAGREIVNGNVSLL